MDEKVYTYEDVVNAVFYAHEKPELLAEIITGAVNTAVAAYTGDVASHSDGGNESSGRSNSNIGILLLHPISEETRQAMSNQ